MVGGRIAVETSSKDGMVPGGRWCVLSWDAELQRLKLLTGVRCISRSSVCLRALTAIVS